ncbi:hypothetical protein MSAN_00325500 [Mycena sanguinolenta]|uniref:Uncharacterized protein n=1 Tax=Mycena sanguinolenta TaxID=230812 RepID=A0A8H6ZBE3_9AGAR|nr:hypothetical protein MSAN_00325500 [Mycena sanguinolenta]
MSARLVYASFDVDVGFNPIVKVEIPSIPTCAHAHLLQLTERQTTTFRGDTTGACLEAILLQLKAPLQVKAQLDNYDDGSQPRTLIGSAIDTRLLEFECPDLQLRNDNREMLCASRADPTGHSTATSLSPRFLGRTLIG